MSFGEEYSMFNGAEYASIDSARFDNKLNIEDIYSDIIDAKASPYAAVGTDYAMPYVDDKSNHQNRNWTEATDDDTQLPEYSAINLSKKVQDRMKKQSDSVLNSVEMSINIRNNNNNDENNFEIYEEVKINNTMNDFDIYEDIETVRNDPTFHVVSRQEQDEGNIYELVRCPK